MGSQRLIRVVVSVCVGVAASAAILTTARWAGAQSATPTLGTCAPVNPFDTEAVRLKNEQCRVSTFGPTTGTCTVYLLQSVPVLDCPGAALQKFSLSAWP
jgi:hypothetical protein